MKALVVSIVGEKHQQWHGTSVMLGVLYFCLCWCLALKRALVHQHVGCSLKFLSCILLVKNTNNGWMYIVLQSARLLQILLLAKVIIQSQI